MTAKVIIAVVLLISGSCVYAQDKEAATGVRPKNNINLNLGGNASIISINYERLFFIKPIFFLAGNFGLGYNKTEELAWNSDYSEPNLTIPHYITGNLGRGRHFFEFGLGGSVIIGNLYDNYYLYPMIGYRLQPLASPNLNLRIFGCFPIYIKNEDEHFSIPFSPVGLSFGICF